MMYDNFRLSSLQRYMLTRALNEGGFYRDEYIEGMPTRRLDELVHAGFLYVRHTPDDRVYLSITYKGKRFLNAA